MDPTPWMRAAFDGDLAAVRTGLDAGLDVDFTSAKGMTPLMMAAWQNDRDEVARLLLDRGATLGLRQPSSGWTAATFAAVNGGVRCLRLFFDRGLVLDPKEDWKALVFAVQYRSRETARMLLEAGFPAEVRDERGRTPLMRAAKNSDEVLVALLLEHGADARAVDTGGWSALHVAAERARPDNVRRLLAAGASLDARTAEGHTALELAEAARKASVAAVLREAAR